MKIIVSEYTKEIIREILIEAHTKAWVNGYNDKKSEQTAREEVEKTTRDIIDTISEYPERVVEL